MLDRYKKQEYRNWVMCFLALAETKNHLENYVEEKFEKFTRGQLRSLSESSQLTENERLHEPRFSFADHCNFISRKNQWLYKSDICDICFDVFEKVKNLHTKLNPGRDDFSWSNVTTCGQLHWDIAKVFMRKGNKMKERPEETDAQNMFQVMRSCRLFANVKVEKHLEQVS